MSQNHHFNKDLKICRNFEEQWTKVLFPMLLSFRVGWGWKFSDQLAWTSYTDGAKQVIYHSQPSSQQPQSEQTVLSPSCLIHLEARKCVLFKDFAQLDDSIFLTAANEGSTCTCRRHGNLGWTLFIGETWLSPQLVGKNCGVWKC